jgi:hypothetical protein
MRRETREGGQATVEWIGLVAAVGLALGALAAGVSGAASGGGGEARAGAEARGLGAALAERITCAARDLCGAGVPASPALRFPPPPKPAPGIRPSAPWERPTQRAALGEFPRLKRMGNLAEHAWVVCFGYRSLQYELEHPRSPREAMPTDEVLDILNDCLNPWQFFFG